MGSATVKIDGFGEIERYFKRMTVFQKSDYAEFVGGEAQAVTEQAFRDQKDPVTDSAWPELSPVTLGRRAKKLAKKKKKGTAILINRGQLKNSIGFEAYTDGSVLLGSNKVYSRIHQEGGRAGRGLKVEIPQRRFLGTDPQFFTRVFQDSAMRNLLGFED